MSMMLLHFLLLGPGTEIPNTKAQFVQHVVQQQEAQTVSENYCLHMKEKAGAVFDSWCSYEDQLSMYNGLLTYLDQAFKRVEGLVAIGDVSYEALHDLEHRRGYIETQILFTNQAIESLSQEMQKLLKNTTTVGFSFDSRKNMELTVEKMKTFLHNGEARMAFSHKGEVGSSSSLRTAYDQFSQCHYENHFLVHDLEDSIALLSSKEALDAFFVLFDRYFTLREQEESAKEEFMICMQKPQEEVSSEAIVLSK
jgi:hypothetical protein